MYTSLRHIGLLLACEICEGEVDLHDDDSGTGTCRHCGIAFHIDAPYASRSESRRRGA